MPMAGKGMLLTSMDIDAAHEAEFNRWYDREHLEERVAIDGFLEARRYVAQTASRNISASIRPRLSRCSTAPPIARRWPTRRRGRRPISTRFKNMIRAVARITISHGVGRGAALGIIRLRPGGGKDKLRAALDPLLDPADLDGIISMHLLESDPALSKPLTKDAEASNPGAGDWFVLIDATQRACGSESFGAHHRQRRHQAAGGVKRRLSAAVRSRQKRPAHSADLHCSAHAALPQVYDRTKV